MPKQNKEKYLKKEIIMNITNEKLKDRFELDLLHLIMLLIV